MSRRTTRFRTVILALCCVVSLLVAPATAVATPDDPFGGDSTESDASGGGLGETLRGADSSSNASHSSTDGTDEGTSDASGGDGVSDDGPEEDDSSTFGGSDADADGGSEDDDASTFGGSDDADGSESSTASEDRSLSGDDSELRSELASVVNTTVGSAEGTVERTTDGDDADDGWDTLDERARAVEDSSNATAETVDWGSLDGAVQSTLPGEAGATTLGVDWYEASLATTSTADATPTLSATVGAVTDDVLTGLDSVVDPEDLATPSTTGSTTAADVPAVAVEEPSADATAPSADTPAPDGPLPSDPAAALVEPGANPSTAGTGSPVPVGSSPATGLALGLGGVAAVAAVRQGLLGATGSGLVGSATTLAAGVVPAVTGRSSALDRLVRMLTAFRYSRYDDSDPLEHEARAAVFDVVESRPGAYLSEVAERADLPLSTARHHVRVLEREDLLTGAKLRGKRRFYPAYAGDMELAAALNDESTAAVLDALARLGGSSVSELADELGRDPSTVTHHLQRLEEDGLVSREREGRSVINRLSAETRAALEPGTEPAASPEASGVVASD